MTGPLPLCTAAGLIPAEAVGACPGRAGHTPGERGGGTSWLQQGSNCHPPLFLQVRHRQSGQIMVLKMNKLMSNRGNMLREVQLMNRLSHPNILRSLPPPSTMLSPVGVPVRGWQQCNEISSHPLPPQNCLVKYEDNGYTAVVGDFGLAEKIPIYSEGSEKEPLAVVGSPYWMAPEVLHGELYNEKADVFAYGIILCETIARVPADPDYLPRTEDFGLDVAAFRNLVDPACPVPFLQLAFHCCGMEPTMRPSFLEITQRLEGILEQQLGTGGSGAAPQADKESAPAPVGSPAPGLNGTGSIPARQGQWLLPPDQRLSRSQSDMFPPRTPGLPRARDTPPRINPFSQREDLKGGRIKLFDTPSKSVISLTFDLPPPSPFLLGTPITPEPAVEAQCDFSEPLVLTRKCRSLPASPELPRREPPRPPPTLFPALNCGSQETPPSPAPELMDCSPDGLEPEPSSPAPPPFPNSSFISTATSGARPWPPNGPLLNNNSVLPGKPHGWGGGFSELSIPPAEQPECSLVAPGSAVLEQDEVLTCPTCCLGPFTFGLSSVCHRPAASTPRYQNLNCEAKSLLCSDRHHRHHKPPVPVLAEPSLKLPEAQS
uniref:Testis associated actin remodelling kinase 1 n=1 Tax=Sphenodon punctatus TaxID=8508 RepID=A0A8D0HHL4_SPHPU